MKTRGQKPKDACSAVYRQIRTDELLAAIQPRRHLKLLEDKQSTKPDRIQLTRCRAVSTMGTDERPAPSTTSESEHMEKSFEPYEHLNIVEQAYAAFHGIYDEAVVARFNSGFCITFLKDMKQQGILFVKHKAATLSYNEDLPQIRQLAVYGAAHLAGQNAPSFDVDCDVLYVPVVEEEEVEVGCLAN